MDERFSLGSTIEEAERGDIDGMVAVPVGKEGLILRMRGEANFWVSSRGMVAVAMRRVLR